MFITTLTLGAKTRGVTHVTGSAETGAAIARTRYSTGGVALAAEMLPSPPPAGEAVCCVWSLACVAA